jgi:hypothetical protein
MTKTQIRKAYEALTAIGAPVICKPDWFVISAEDNNGTVWAVGPDYMNPKIEAILAKHGLDYCWHDAGAAFIHAA